jgi:hypothetical protein
MPPISFTTTRYLAPFLVEYPCDMLNWCDLVSAFIKPLQDLAVSQRITLCLWVMLTIAYSLWCLKIIQDLFLKVLVSLLQNASHRMG